MSELYFRVRDALRERDIEGLIAQGVPEEEYESEARQIFENILLLPCDGVNEESLKKILYQVWGQSFDLTAQEIKLREPFIVKAINKILKSK